MNCTQCTMYNFSALSLALTGLSSSPTSGVDSVGWVNHQKHDHDEQA